MISRSFAYFRIKRLLDLILVLVLFILLTPIFLVIWISIWISMGSPVFFRQLRPGIYGQVFILLKFRTMTFDQDSRGKFCSDSVRMTGLGKFLRRFSLDELPQLINILRGEMSFIGPRPLLLEYLPLYSLEQGRRHDVLPGITGWAQVNGRNASSWSQRFDHDLWYIDHISLGLDIKIIRFTIGTILSGRGVNKDNGVTMTKFSGEDL